LPSATQSVPTDRSLVCRYVQLAQERHERDLRDGGKRRLWFDEEAADRVVRFFSLLKHSKGEWAGNQFALEEWQQWMLRVLFGWKTKDGNRRFREAWIELARKNGKSTLAAGIGHYLAFADNEPGAEVYTAATKKDQACIVHSEAIRMARSMRKESKLWNGRLKIFKNNISDLETGSKYEPLGADADSTDGLNIHGCVVDEVHAHKNRDLYDRLKTATGSRRQPMQVNITTAGVAEKESLGWQMHQHAIKVLEGAVEDDGFFAYIATLDEDDDWRDKKNWIKANPNLGVSVKPESLEDAMVKAEHVPASQNAFRRFHLNQWVQQEHRVIDMKCWRECAGTVDINELKGLPCYIGNDLSARIDFTSTVALFAAEKRIIALPFFWLPESMLAKRAARDRVPYNTWREQGHLEVTPGDVVDYDFMEAKLDWLVSNFDVKEIGFDPWNAQQLMNRLTTKGYPVVEVRQGYITLSGPTKEFIALVLNKGLRHGNNPVMNWMVSNLAVATDPAGNFKPDKSKASEKIDGPVALIIALARLMVGGGEASVYDEHGIQTF
jgi:phage terminase large subunit-like protein